MSQPATDKDFQPLPEYSQTKVSNETWVNVTTTKTDSDGTVTQTSAIVGKK
jgi:hypothetical protein